MVLKRSSDEGRDILCLAKESRLQGARSVNTNRGNNAAAQLKLNLNLEVTFSYEWVLNWGVHQRELSTKHDSGNSANGFGDVDARSLPIRNNEIYVSRHDAP